MANDIGEDWLEWQESVMMIWDGINNPEGADVPYIRRPENEGPFLTPDEERKLMEKQVDASEGFDIDFNKFRCTFNYLPLNLDDDKAVPLNSGTIRELIDKLSRDSIQKHNDGKDPKIEFVRVIKANYHDAGAGYVFYITIEVMDLSAGKSKLFQAKVWYAYDLNPTKIICNLKPENMETHNPKPEKNVHSIETEEKQDPDKKPRLSLPEVPSSV